MVPKRTENFFFFEKLFTLHWTLLDTCYMIMSRAHSDCVVGGGDEESDYAAVPIGSRARISHVLLCLPT